MDSARAKSVGEQGGRTVYQVMFNLAEYQARAGRDGYRWDGEAFVGGDINRFWLKSEGEGAFGDRLESAEVQALYSRAIGPYFDLQAGVRQDFGQGPNRSEEHTSELQSLMRISYAVFCLKKKKNNHKNKVKQRRHSNKDIKIK